MPVSLKICGITRLEDALAAADLGVDWLGFNFFPDSPRYINISEAAVIIERLPPKVESVGILVKPTLAEVNDTIKKSNVRRVQIYEPQGFMNFSLLPVPGIFCLRWNGDRIPEYKRFQADMILVDYFDPKLFGGSGQTLAWEHIPKEIPRERLILAGGITSANISRALEMVNPAVVDVASGAESSPGLKDLSKVKSLVAQVRKYNQDKKI